ncbi:MAG: hypothetical protein ABIL05_04340 [candidate division WOR-3 bacterium]
MSIKKYLISLILCIFILLILRKFLFPSEIEEIKKTIYKGKNSIEKESSNGVMALLDPEFSDNYGNNYSDIDKAISQFFNTVDSIDIKISIRSIHINIQPNSQCAVCSLRVRIFGSIEGERGIIYGAIKPADVILRLIKKERLWLFRTISY